MNISVFITRFQLRFEAYACLLLYLNNITSFLIIWNHFLFVPVESNQTFWAHTLRKGRMQIQLDVIFGVMVIITSMSHAICPTTGFSCPLQFSKVKKIIPTKHKKYNFYFNVVLAPQLVPLQSWGKTVRFVVRACTKIIMYVHVNIFGEVLVKGTFCSAHFSGTSSREFCRKYYFAKKNCYEFKRFLNACTAFNSFQSPPNNLLLPTIYFLYKNIVYEMTNDTTEKNRLHCISLVSFLLGL